MPVVVVGADRDVDAGAAELLAAIGVSAHVHVAAQDAHRVIGGGVRLLSLDCFLSLGWLGLL